MSGTVRVIAGECTTAYERTDERRERRGRVVVVHKPDDTVLVHDAEGYQPVEWLTRADAVYRERNDDGDGLALVAVKGDERLRVEAEGAERLDYRGTSAGPAVGTCPSCDGTLVRARGALTCLDCDADHGLPRDASVLESTCECGLPQMAVERGDRFELCVNRDCESLDDAVRDAFDREWSCPDCGGDLRVLRERSLFLGCENYPDCETTFALPDERVVGDCECGLPHVAGGGDEPSCLDSDCDERRNAENSETKADRTADRETKTDRATNPETETGRS